MMRIAKPALFTLVVLAAVWSGLGIDPARSAPDTALQEYVDRRDPSTRWFVRRELPLGQSTVQEIRLISQTWRGVEWRHQLFLLIPPNVSKDVNHALLFIAGGRWKPKYDEDDYSGRISSNEAVYEALAMQLGTPLAVLKQVPFQPMFEGKREDALIAMTFDEYLKTGEEEWPLLLPMVKSAVHAMDAVSEAAKDRGFDIRSFTVTGASKRGWTTWLTAAVDARVKAIAPMVIDVLDMDRQLDYQTEVWGEPSTEVEDYTDIRLGERFATPEGQDLLKIIDPFSYLDRIKQPKLLIIGTNDEYWPVDALKLYWDELSEPRYHLYIPNNKHRLRDYPRLFGALRAINDHAAGMRELPQLHWQLSENEQEMILVVDATPAPTRVFLWRADAEKRDFRESHFSPSTAVFDGENWRAALMSPDSGFRAYFAEVVFDPEGSSPFSLSTHMTVLPHVSASHANTSATATSD